MTPEEIARSYVVVDEDTHFFDYDTDSLEEEELIFRKELEPAGGFSFGVGAIFMFWPLMLFEFYMYVSEHWIRFFLLIGVHLAIGIWAATHRFERTVDQYGRPINLTTGRPISEDPVDEYKTVKRVAGNAAAFGAGYFIGKKTGL